MLSRDANYNMDTALDEINQKKLLLDIKVETQVILQLLVANNIVTREEVSKMIDSSMFSQLNYTY